MWMRVVNIFSLFMDKFKLKERKSRQTTNDGRPIAYNLNIRRQSSVNGHWTELLESKHEPNE